MALGNDYIKTNAASIPQRDVYFLSGYLLLTECNWSAIADGITLVTVGDDLNLVC
jgi:hypothetical protein